MRIKKLYERTALLRNLLSWVYIYRPTDDERDEAWFFNGQFKNIWDKDLTADELAHMTTLCQTEIRLPIYTVSHAAAWLGMSKRGVVEAYRAGRLPYIQPGREVLFLHDDLVKFAQERRYEL